MQEKHHHSGRRSSKLLINYKKLINNLKLTDLNNIIDIGCGEGDFAIALSKNTNIKNIFALDIHSESIEKLKEKIEKEKITNITPLNEDFTAQTSISDNTIDAAIFINVMHGFYVNQETDKAIKELKRILRPSGMVIIVDFKKIQTPSGPPLSERLSAKELRKIFSDYKFIPVLEQSAGLFHYIQIFKYLPA